MTRLVAHRVAQEEPVEILLRRLDELEDRNEALERRLSTVEKLGAVVFTTVMFGTLRDRLAWVLFGRVTRETRELATALHLDAKPGVDPSQEL